MPVQYAGILEEHRAVRERAGLFDLSHMGELFVEGPEAGAALAAALVTNPPALADRARPLLDDLRARRRRSSTTSSSTGWAEERFLVVANAGNAAVVSRRARRAARRLQGGPRRPLAGDGARRGPGPARGRDPRAADRRRPRRACATTRSPRARSPGIPALVARTGYTGEDGFEVFVETGRAGELWDALLDGGPRGRWSCRSAWAPATRCGSRRACRSTATSSTATTNPYDAGLGRVVKLDKPGDFVGRAALERVAADGPGQAPRRAGRRGPRHRPPRLPGPCRRAADRRRHQRHPVADARRADRDGLRRAGRCRAGYDARRRDPRAPVPAEVVAAAVLPAPDLTVAELAPATGRRARRTRRRRARRRYGRRWSPADLRYTKDHEWVRVDGDEATSGSRSTRPTSSATSSSSSCPTSAGRSTSSPTFGVVESVKAVSDLFAPVGGEVVATNDAPGRQPGARQQRPVRRRLDDPGPARRRRPARRAARRGRLRRR